MPLHGAEENMDGIILPDTYVPGLDAPLIYLAGPISGAPQWHDEAIAHIRSQSAEVLIASPQQVIDDRLRSLVLAGDDTHFPRQRAWERHYMDIAAKTGGLLFWLPEETAHSCVKPYASMTRFELGRELGRYAHDPTARFCVGSDGRFSELDVIAYDLSIDAPDVEILPTLERTCDAALRLASR